ncbi:M28 family peptidase [Rhodopila sp.]|uniref:M28 family peptidase n=1 Tax=Rhodopila sp. TaxID=2480087 RepID=UPI003D0C3367
MMDQDVARLAAAVDPAIMMRHLEEFARRIKLSGTAPELESFRYLQTTLDSYGYRTELIRHDAYISLPGRARIEIDTAAPDTAAPDTAAPDITAPDSAAPDSAAPNCITHSFSRPSPPGGLRGTVVYAGHGRAEDFAALDASGKIVLLESIANPGATHRASLAGAIGQIHISPHQHLHEMCVSPVWGSPTSNTIGDLPTTVVLSLRKADGDALKQRVQRNEPVEAVLHAEVDTGWRKTPLLVAELPSLKDASLKDASLKDASRKDASRKDASGKADGPNDDDPFVLFSGHHDTWHYGVMDNGGANATMLEIARLFAPEQAAWRRGLRLCFWSGHSHGRYSGSTWYADTNWHELGRRCIAHVNVDSTGARGNTVMADALACAELSHLAADAVRMQGGQQLDGHRMSRAGDQSFWGIGIPSLFMGMGEQPAGSADNVMGAVFGGGARKGAGFGWWWHTPDDTLDKMDPDLLARDTKVYVHAIWRLLTDSVLPLDYAASAAALDAQLSALRQQLDGRFELSGLTKRVARLRQQAAAVSAAAAAITDASAAHRFNQALVAVSRAMVPMDYTTGDRFDHDPALPQPPYPVLNVVRQLAAAPPNSDQARFLAGAATRACNRLAFALDQANQALEACRDTP